MGFRINTNVASMQAMGNLSRVTKQAEESSAKLSSGERITKSADDAAGLAVSEKLKSEVKSARQAGRNANDGISMIQTAEGGLNEVSSILTRMREIAIQSASDTVGDSEREMSNFEYQGLKAEVERISKITEFNGTKLLDGSTEKLDVQVGIRGDQGQNQISVDFGKLASGVESLGVSELTVSSKESAREGLDAIDGAIEKISGQRALLGASQNRLVTASQHLNVFTENLSAANSRIRDVDYAEETAKNARNSIMSSAATSVLSQANTSAQQALRLIG